jgi:hypothetical protein
MVKIETPKLSSVFFLLFSLLFALQVLPRLSWDSLTNDEPTDITNGYYYWIQGDVQSPHNHPPLGSALQALPLLFMDLKTGSVQGDVIDRGHAFIFNWNLRRLEAITWASRAVSFLLGLSLGFILWRVTRQDPVLCFFTLFFWSMDPTLLALSGLAKTDIAPTLFFFLALLSFHKALGQPTRWNSILSGILTGLAVASKFYCLVLIPLFLGLELFQKGKLLFLWEIRGALMRRWGLGLAGMLAALSMVFLPGTLFLPDHREPFYYLAMKFKENLVFAQNPFPVFLLGQSSLVSHWYYLPIAFLLKEPIPFILFILLAKGLMLGRQIHWESWQWMPPALFLLAMMPTLNLGVRYLLPAMPFVYLLAAQAASWLWRKSPGGKGRPFKLVTGGLILWQATSLFLSFPHALSYFNEAVPPGKKINYLADSNLDWSQDHKRLAQWAHQRGWGKIHLAYYGAVDPAVYGVDWEPWREGDLNSPRPGGIYAVNASFLQLAPMAYPGTREIAHSWIRSYPPTGRVGDCWYYYEIPGDARENTSEPYLYSVPFLQYRGYTPFSKRF